MADDIIVCDERPDDGGPQDIVVCEPLPEQGPQDIVVCDPEWDLDPCAKANPELNPLYLDGPADGGTLANFVVGTTFEAGGGVRPYTWSTSGGITLTISGDDNEFAEIASIDSCGAAGTDRSGAVSVDDQCGQTASQTGRLDGGSWSGYAQTCSDDQDPSRCTVHTSWVYCTSGKYRYRWNNKVCECDFGGFTTCDPPPCTSNIDDCPGPYPDSRRRWGIWWVQRARWVC